MQVLFVGGAHEVGGSCVALELSDSWVLVDAGVRLAGNTDPLPDFALLQGKPVRAIFVTHAHADHIGALPLMHQAFPTIPIYASRATGLLMEVMFSDALHIMERRAQDEMELPLYVPEAVTQMLAQVRPLPLDTPVTLPELPDITVQAARAGHIAGAISLGFAGPTESIVISGDISVTAQRTVLGAQSPRLPHPDLLILESTYGTRLHANRKAEEDRFVAAVAEGIQRGGHVLIPAFGLGRGQEVILILQEAMLKQQIPAFPIYVDGLVRRVCATYQLLPEALPPRLARQISKGYLPFAAKHIHFVRDEHERERIVQGEPACIVSSSGMLTGGPSVWYATRLAGKPEASIFLTGYQDEEAPGRRLLAVAEKQTDTLELDGTTVKVTCTVDKYSLSAHADGGELATYAQQLRPRQVALVHGDDEARAALRVRLGDSIPVILPRNGTMLDLLPKQNLADKPGGRHPATTLSTVPTGIGMDRPFTAEHVAELYQVVAPLPAFRIVTARELARIWYGAASQETTQTILSVLAEEPAYRYFVSQATIPDAFQVQLSPKGGGSLPAPKKASAWADQHAILATLERHLGTPPDLYRRSVNPRTGDLTLAFHFPEIARQRYAEALAQAAAESQITIILTERPHQGMLAQAAQAHLPPGVTLRRAPAIFHDRREVHLECIGAIEHDAVLASMHQFFTETGWTLSLTGPEVATVPPGWASSVHHADPLVGDPLVSPPFQQGHPLGMTEALQIAQQQFAACPGYIRTRVQSGSHTLAPRFTFPDVARTRYATLAQEIEQRTGWSVRFYPHVHHDALAHMAEQVLPAGLTKRTDASLYAETKTISLPCLGEATSDAIASAQAAFTHETGWQLLIIGSDGHPPSPSMGSREEAAIPSLTSGNELG